jgi:hypothetical protein
MRAPRKLTLALALVALLAAALTACGGGDSEGSTTPPTGPATEETTAAPTTAGEGSGSSAEFRTPGGDNSIQNFGEESDAIEVAAATSILGDYLEARSQDDFGGQCASLARSVVAPLEDLASRSPQFGKKGCAAVLATLLAGAPSSTRVNTMSSGIASLRVGDDRAFALYHGPRGVDYFVPLVKEDGEWKVGALEPTEFP